MTNVRSRILKLDQYERHKKSIYLDLWCFKSDRSFFFFWNDGSVSLINTILQFKWITKLKTTSKINCDKSLSRTYQTMCIYSTRSCSRGYYNVVDLHGYQFHFQFLGFDAFLLSSNRTCPFNLK